MATSTLGQAWHAHLDLGACCREGATRIRAWRLTVAKGTSGLKSTSGQSNKKPKVSVPSLCMVIAGDQSVSIRFRLQAAMRQILEKERIVEVADVERVAREAGFSASARLGHSAGVMMHSPFIGWLASSTWVQSHPHVESCSAGTHFEAHPAPSHCLWLREGFLEGYYRGCRVFGTWSLAASLA